MMTVLGIDIGGSSIKAGLVNTQGVISEKKTISIQELRNGNMVNNILDWIDTIMADNQPKAVGIGVPGLLSKDKRTILEVTNLPEIEGVRFVNQLYSKYPDIKFYFSNDANAAALGTYKFCPQVSTDCFGYITIGTGIGSAVIINGKLYEGGNGNGPELGMISLHNGKTIDDTAAKNGLIDICKKLYPAYQGNTIVNPDTLTAESLFRAANQNDPLALKTFESLGTNIAEALAIFIMLFDVTTIYIGGGISPSFKFLEKPIKEKLKSSLTNYYLENLVIEEASLGNDSGILGAAALCF
ncbi:ROK family protein [Reichenbachiella sp. MALMAid0571]|uniref:ROK family protein n=1 Tax=Reichenbachiella sp. MALMAid0571 TaxID=3143939 RepID=UPI0032DF9F4A